MKLLVPERSGLDPVPTAGVEVVAYDIKSPLASQHHDAEAIVVYQNPAAMLSVQARALRSVRWVQTIQAGGNAVLAAGFREEATLTLGRGLHARPVAEHTLALVLAAARRLHELRDAQHARRWETASGSAQNAAGAAEFRSLLDAEVVLLGFGSIARAAYPLLLAFGARVTVVARSDRHVDGVHVHAIEALPTLLPTADLLLMALPSTATTRGLVGRNQLARMKPTAWIVNVGRGDTLDEVALVEALAHGDIGGAALDVFEREPLPPDARLWTLANVIVSPHAAGGRPIGARELVQENLARFMAGEPLLHVIDRVRGY